MFFSKPIRLSFIKDLQTFETNDFDLWTLLANSFKETSEFPPLVTRMVGVGETSGSLEATVAKVSEYYDSEVPKAINQVFALMEPLLLLVMGLGVGFVAFSIFIPMFSMVNVVKMH